MIKYLLSTLLIMTGLNVSGSAQTLRGTILSKWFIGEVTKDTVAYNIYLPQGYAADMTRYPVIYNLHGLSGDQFRHNNAVASHFETAQDSGLIGPVIVVFPNGYRNSYWADSFDDDKPAETNIVRELIPTVDSLYRTIPDRQFRVIYGFSMGGFGASKFITKYPQLFKTCVIHDGSMQTWSTLVDELPVIARDIFNNDESYFNRFAPWTFVARRDSLLQLNVSIRIVVGALRTLNQGFRDTLRVHGIPFEYKQTTCGHELPCILEAEGLNTATFVAMSLATPTGVETSVATLPDGYTLQQNYPNPFNPATKITFAVPKPTEVKLEIYNLVGQVVATPIDNQVYNAGEHFIAFDASSLTSGIYFYKMRAENFVDFKKMTFVK